MAESILKRYVDDEGARASRANSHVPRLDLKLLDGSRIGFGYSNLVWMTYRSAEGIMLHFSTHEVMLKGTALEMLYRGIAAQEVPEVVAASVTHVAPGEEASTPVVTNILVVSKPGTEGEGSSPFKSLDA